MPPRPATLSQVGVPQPALSPAPAASPSLRLHAQRLWPPLLGGERGQRSRQQCFGVVRGLRPCPVPGLESAAQSRSEAAAGVAVGIARDFAMRMWGSLSSLSWPLKSVVL